MGRILSLHFHVGTYLTLMNSISRHQAEVEGAIAMDYAHQPDLFYWWLGKMPVRVYAAGCRGGDLPLQSNPNLMAVTLEYEEPLIATIHMNYLQHPDRGACEVIGDRGWALFDATFQLAAPGHSRYRVGNRPHLRPGAGPPDGCRAPGLPGSGGRPPPARESGPGGHSVHADCRGHHPVLEAGPAGRRRGVNDSLRRGGPAACGTARPGAAPPEKESDEPSTRIRHRCHRQGIQADPFLFGGPARRSWRSGPAELSGLQRILPAGAHCRRDGPAVRWEDAVGAGPDGQGPRGRTHAGGDGRGSWRRVRGDGSHLPDL